MSRLRQMSVFAHIVEAGSITAAAEVLGVSKSVVSQHLKTLETELEVTLLKRTTRQQVLTEVGEGFYLSCKQLNQVADEAWNQAQETLETPKGRVRITAATALMETLITPVVAELIQQYPQLEPELVSSDDHLDLRAHDIDLAIRVGQSVNSSLKQRRIGEFRDVLCGCDSLLSQHPSDNLSYIANLWQSKQVRHEFIDSRGQIHHFSTQARCLTNTFHSSLALIKAGAGIGVVPDFYLPLVQPQLVPVFADYRLPRNTIYALTPYSGKLPLAVEVCISAIEWQLARLV
ncbi:LysR family transcriptional regulator [Ferrimonas lipolytica]|uniref:LysR family transcriptional regulator n=1 Tax=Ferrimonas lipolytica TaxID=2724191 RepID=A0A6H1UEK5_9GAMM|nr:LysR substrate-binding domain-containing protein [Ferrimonas lipolytica]QIZ77059.1 LysR family transcriptional regulator [Ferrimonas lipolytica]